MKASEILPDEQNTTKINGITIRKGSVGAFLANWRVLQDASRANEHASAKADLLELLPALKELGLFEVLTPRDPLLAQWLIDHNITP